MPRRRIRRVAILVETSRAYGRGLLDGVARYNRERGNWLTYFVPQGLGDSPPAWLSEWKGDGILARIENRRAARVIGAAGVPVVNLRGTMSGLPFPFIGADNRAVARLGAEHLLGRGFRQFGFVGFRPGYHPGFDRRAALFKAFIEQAGYRCDLYRPPTSQAPLSWDLEEEAIASWLREIPKPVGIMSCNDDRGLQVLDACRRVEAAVPDEVAVLGVDNDEFLCGLAIPPLTSIDINSRETGYRAAALLDRMMSGRSPPRRPRETEPAGVITRRSTDVLATGDQKVVQAVQFIREHACGPLKLDVLLAGIGLSRSALESRMRDVLGRTIQQEIRHVRLTRVHELLVTTDMPIKEIAWETGFKNVQYMTRVFKNETGTTPAVFRKEKRWIR